jgi:hypothetical protein
MMFLETGDAMAQRLFARGELAGAAVEVLRRAGEPLSVAEIARRVLAAKGVPTADAITLRRIRLRLQQAFVALDKAGVTMVATRGAGARRGLAKHPFPACLSADLMRVPDCDADVLSRLQRVSEAWRKVTGADPAAGFELKGASLFVMTQLLEDAQEEILRAGLSTASAS